jgi:twitching motility protein PilI
MQAQVETVSNDNPSPALPADPFELLLAYEAGARAHSARAAEQAEAPGLWRGIGYRIGSQWLISSIAEVNEILTPPPMTSVPGAKPWLIGVANVRGNLAAIVDLKLFLEGERTVSTERSRVLLARQPGGMVGLLVDEVAGQRNLTDENQPIHEVDDDPRYRSFIKAHFAVDGRTWSVFSMGALTRLPEFRQAAQ